MTKRDISFTNTTCIRLNRSKITDLINSYREIEKAKKAQKALKSFEKKLKDQLISQTNLSTKTMEDFAQLIDKAAYSTGADAYLASELRV